MMGGVTLPTLMAVAGGGAAGAVSRFLMVSFVGHIAGPNFPWGTLTVNVIGSILMGFLIELSALVWSPAPEIRAMIVVGFLGSFTTFSTFSMDIYYLYERGGIVGPSLYVAASLILGVGGFLGGMFFGRVLFT